MSLPPGFRFEPTEFELVRYYLLNKVTGNPLPCNLVIDCDLYGDMEPWEIWDRFHGSMSEYSDKDLYFFTELKKKSSNGSRIERRVGSNGGTWHGEDSGKKCKAMGVDDDVCVAWTQKRFRYDNPQCKKHNGLWLMQEYSLDQSLLLAPTSIVLCRIRKNEKKRRKIAFIDDADECQRSIDPGLGEIDQYCSHDQSKRLKLEQHQQPQVIAEIEGEQGQTSKPDIEFQETNAEDMANSRWNNDDLKVLVELTFEVEELLNDQACKNDAKGIQTSSTLEQTYDAGAGEDFDELLNVWDFKNAVTDVQTTSTLEQTYAAGAAEDFLELLSDQDFKNDVKEVQTTSTLEQTYAAGAGEDFVELLSDQGFKNDVKDVQTTSTLEQTYAAYAQTTSTLEQTYAAGAGEDFVELLNDQDLKNDVKDAQTTSTLEQNNAAEAGEEFEGDYDFVDLLLSDSPQDSGTLECVFTNAREEADVLYNSSSNCQSALLPIQTC